MLVRVKPTEVTQAVSALRTYGCVLIERAVSHEPLHLLRERMDQDTEELLSYCETIGGNPRELGHLQQGPPLSPDFVFAEVAMNRYVNEILVDLYQHRPRLTFYNGNTNCPGSTTQGIHMDGVHLTKHPEPVHETKAVVVNIPPNPMSEANGAIQIWPGTHMLRDKGQANRIDPEHGEVRAKEVPPLQPKTELGDVLIRDVRLWHRGVPNESNRPRHMIALIVSEGEHPSKHKLKFERGCELALEGHTVDANADYVDEPIEYLVAPTKRIYEARKRRPAE